MNCKTARTSKFDDSTALLKDFDRLGDLLEGPWTPSWESESPLGDQLDAQSAQLKSQEPSRASQEDLKSPEERLKRAGERLKSV